MIEIYLLTSLAPIPFATVPNRETGHMGQNYFRSLFAVGFQGLLILVCVAIYAVLIQSSIESQIDFCKYELKGGSCRVFKDKGYSGKNTDRPEFQKLLGEIRKGKVRRVIVYKLDRISRSILDFATMMELFQEYDVEFVSSTEKFDTSTPMGRAMLNICIVFAQLERETIQKRVTDAYYSRCLKGFHMSGQAPYGYQLEPML